MNANKQRIAIAEWCGIAAYDERIDYGFSTKTGIPCNVPDYLNDLNAMNEAEKLLKEIKVARYVSELWAAMCRTNAPECYIGAIHATAAQRAEALLKTIGAWK
jgi:hypothetical protein